MKRLFFVIFLVYLLAGVSAQAAYLPVDTVASRTGVFKLKNDKLEIWVAPKKNHSILKIIDRVTRRNFIVKSKAQVNLYTISLTDKRGTKSVASNLEAASIKAHLFKDNKTQEQLLTIDFKHENPDMTVSVSIRLPREGALSYWRLDVENNSNLAIIAVDFPGFTLPQVLGSEPDQSCVLIPNSAYSSLYWNLPREFQFILEHRYLKAGYWPCILKRNSSPDAIQMMACYDKLSGLYMATHDRKGYIKQMEIVGLDQETLRLKFNHIRSWSFGKNFKMDYEVVMGTFQGDWMTAADIYRNWATQQAWCSKGKVKYRQDTPSWIKRSPIFMRFLFKQPKDTKIDGFYEKTRCDWEKVPEYLDHFEYPDIIKDAIVHLQYYSKMGGWSGYYNEVWPAWMGDDKLKNLVGEIKARGLHPTMQPFGWVLYTRDKQRPDYKLEKQPFFRDLWEHSLIHRENETQAPKTIGRNDYRPIPNAAYICIASDDGKNVFENYVSKVAPWGVDMMQTMETTLSEKFNCFNKAHGHPLGKGKWIWDAAIENFMRTKKTGTRLNPDFVHDKELSAELLIPTLDCMWIRTSQALKRRWNGRPELYKNNVSLFDYIYHEYIILIDAFMELNPVTARFSAATAVVQGHITGPIFGSFSGNAFHDAAIKGGAWEIIRQGQKAKGSYAREYLVFGKVIPPADVEFPLMEQPEQWVRVKTPKVKRKKSSFLTPKVIHYAHLSEKGQVGMSFINVSDETLPFEIEFSKYKKYLNSGKVNLVIRHNGKVTRKISNWDIHNKIKLRIKPLVLLYITIEPA